jgi:hypothetical protein
LPEWLFDMDMPGHYLRRLKKVGLSIPCVAGPYASVNCRLTLMKSVIRVSNEGNAPYAIASDDDPRVAVSYGAVESIVTSTGRDDDGTFEASLRDERYLPFEYAGTVSTWRLELTSAFPQFDRATLSDVVMHLRYTARDGGEELARLAREALEIPPIHRETLDGEAGHVAAVSCREAFPADWARAAAANPSSLELPIDGEHLPYWMRAAGLEIKKVFRIRLARADESLTAGAPEEAQKNGNRYDLGEVDSACFDVIALLIVDG